MWRSAVPGLVREQAPESGFHVGGVIVGEGVIPVIGTEQLGHVVRLHLAITQKPAISHHYTLPSAGSRDDAGGRHGEPIAVIAGNCRLLLSGYEFFFSSSTVTRICTHEPMPFRLHTPIPLSFQAQAGYQYRTSLGHPCHFDSIKQHRASWVVFFCP